MQVSYYNSYERTLKFFQKKHKQLIPIIEETIELLQTDKEDTRLKYKKINCQKDKNRYSVRVINKPYRILFTVFENEYKLICICDHDQYDKYNKRC